jgi:type IV pilus assembly protein PilB
MDRVATGCDDQGLQPRKRLGQILQDMRVVSSAQVQEALERQRAQPGKKLGEILVERGHATREEVYEALGKQYQIPFVVLANLTIEPAAIRLMPRAVAVENRIIPIKLSGQTVTLAMADMLDLYTLDNIRFILHRDVDCVLATPEDVRDAIRRHYPASDA